MANDDQDRVVRAGFGQVFANLSGQDGTLRVLQTSIGIICDEANAISKRQRARTFKRNFHLHRYGPTEQRAWTLFLQFVASKPKLFGSSPPYNYRFNITANRSDSQRPWYQVDYDGAGLSSQRFSTAKEGEILRILSELLIHNVCQMDPSASEPLEYIERRLNALSARRP